MTFSNDFSFTHFLALFDSEKTVVKRSVVRRLYPWPNHLCEFFTVRVLAPVCLRVSLFHLFRANHLADFLSNLRQNCENIGTFWNSSSYFLRSHVHSDVVKTDVASVLFESIWIFPHKSFIIPKKSAHSLWIQMLISNMSALYQVISYWVKQGGVFRLQLHSTF